MSSMRVWNWGLIGRAFVLLVVAAGVSHVRGDVVETGSDVFASLSGFVYCDINNSGTYDNSEDRLRDVLIILDGLIEPIDPDSPEAEAWGVGQRPLEPGEKETHQRIAWTDSQGFYRFDNVLPGTYSVTEVTPYMFVEGCEQEEGGKVKERDKVNSEFVGEMVTSNQFAEVVLPPGSEGFDYNFGEWGLRTKYISKRALIVVVPEPSVATLTVIVLLLGLYWRSRC